MSLLNHFELDTIDIRCTPQRTKQVPALTYGNFGINDGGLGLVVTHIPSGYSFDNKTGPLGTLQDAARVIGLLSGLDVDWSKPWDEDDDAHTYFTKAERRSIMIALQIWRESRRGV